MAETLSKIQRRDNFTSTKMNFRRPTQMKASSIILAIAEQVESDDPTVTRKFHCHQLPAEDNFNS